MSALKTIRSLLLLIGVAVVILLTVGTVFWKVAGWLIARYPFQQLVVSLLLVIVISSGASSYA